MELKKCCNHAFLVRPPDTADESADVDRFEVTRRLYEKSFNTHTHTHIQMHTNMPNTSDLYPVLVTVGDSHGQASCAVVEPLGITAAAVFCRLDAIDVTRLTAS